jgi:hypothetical protein
LLVLSVMADVIPLLVKVRNFTSLQQCTEAIIATDAYADMFIAGKNGIIVMYNQPNFLVSERLPEDLFA